jgi:hypothetical protein
MVAVGDMGSLWWSGGGVRRNGGLVGLVYAAERRVVVGAEIGDRGADNEVVCAKRSGCGWVSVR